MRWQDIENDKEKYHAYLASREWSVLKECVHSRSGGKCERCRHNRIDAVHHLTYIRKYSELLTDLQGLCNGCHAFIHAKSNVDPILSAPVVVMGLEVRSVYLAGKITSPDWRPLGDSSEVVDVSDYPGVDNRPWFSLKDKRHLEFSGPYTIGSGHGCYSGRHGADCWGGEHYSIFKTDPAIVSAHQTAIGTSSLFFAWVDSQDCFGTLVEIGFARAYRRNTRFPVVLVAGPKCFHELWFSYCFADLAWFGDREPIAALNSMLLDGKGSSFDVDNLPQTRPHELETVERDPNWVPF